MRSCILLAALAASLAACGNDESPEPDPPIRVTPVDPQGAARLTVLPHGTAPADGVRPVVYVDVAATHEARRRGLGGRDHLPAYAGMLFVYRQAALRTFWMKDCAIALDIAYLDDDGRIVSTATLGPGTGVPPEDVPRAHSAAPARFVLEANAGFLARHGVGSGDRVDVTAATEGVEPE